MAETFVLSVWRDPFGGEDRFYNLIGPFPNTKSIQGFWKSLEKIESSLDSFEMEERMTFSVVSPKDYLIERTDYMKEWKEEREWRTHR